MAYADKVTTLQRFVSWNKGHNINFEGVLIDGHLLVGRHMGNNFGTPVLTIELNNQYGSTVTEELDDLFPDHEWALIDRPEPIEPRVDFETKPEKED